MAEDGDKSSDGFEPPKYIASLIAAVNDGAKAAQGGALLFALVGVYLLATAFSASDEDLLRGRTVTISQIGATLPVSFSFAIAPFVFVFLHIYTLVRYDMLAANVRQFLAEMQRTVPWEVDRERCRQLLANVEFIQALVAPRGPRQYSPVWRGLVWGVVAIFPVFVLLLVQINALRYQSELITRVQQFGLLLDLSALVWFFHRAPLDASAPQRESRRAKASRWARVPWLPAIVMWLSHWAKLLWLPVIVMGLNLVYMNVVPVEARLVRYDLPVPDTWRQYLLDAFDNPLDVVLCPSLNWGCRYLRVDHRTLVDHVWDDKAMADLRRGGADQAKLAAVEGLVLRGRSLRFAVLGESLLFNADLIGADLRKASLNNALLPGAKLAGTRLQGANLSGAQLQGADLSHLSDKIMSGAQLQGAWLRKTKLQGAELSHAQLQGADLLEAQLQGAKLVYAELQGADLSGAQLEVADLSGAQLQGADLSQSPDDGVSGAQLQGANLSGAQLQGANLSGAWLWRASSTATYPGIGGLTLHTDLGLSDLQGADFTTPLKDDEVKALHAALDAIPDTNLKAAAEKRLGRLLAADQSADQLRFTASPERQVLVSGPKAPVFADISPEWLITSPTPAYTGALVALLADGIAAGDPAIAQQIAFRATWDQNIDGRRWLYAAVACRLLVNARVEKVKLEPVMIELLTLDLRIREIECEPAKPLAPH
jgi:uncharacterized protein YjbI with pentapeptide repeats